jgi:hypothetical protein
MSKTYLIVQHPTGFADGHYHVPKEEVEDIKKHWDERFPDCTHSILELEERGANGFYAITDATFLPNVAANLARQEEKT